MKRDAGVPDPILVTADVPAPVLVSTAVPAVPRTDTTSGVQGPPGEQGEPGPVGPQGPQGDDGPTGSTGPTGPQGDPGVDGVDGADGARGDVGPQGDVGATGAQGPQGPKGDLGDTGPAGSDAAPNDNRSVTGLSIFDRRLVDSTAGIGLGRIYLTFFTATKDFTTSQFRAHVLSGATGITLSRVGLYAVDASDNATLIASTVNDVTLFSVSATVYTRSWQAPVSLVKGERYAIGPYVSASGNPTFLVNYQHGSSAALLNLHPRVGAMVVGPDLPASISSGAYGNANYSIYFELLP